MSYRIFSTALALIGLLSSSLLVQASETTRSSKSISFSSSAQLDQSARDAQLSQSEADVMAALITTGYRPESTAMAVHISSTSSSHAGEYTIYDTSTDLLSDLDADGFYHRFSLLIDADTIFTTARVYARLYLSYEGGPWNQYATSNNYLINGDSSLDSFVIETELADGFAPGYYDLRVELYDADTNEWLLSYGPYDDAALRALPLEDSYYDDLYAGNVYPIQTEVVIAASGAMSGYWLVLPALVLALRSQRGRKRRQTL